METRQGTIRVLMLPWLAHGHISPFLELAKKLSERKFHIYFCSTPINLSSIKKTISDQKYNQSIQLVELHLQPLPELPPRYQTTNGLPAHLMPTLKAAFEKASPSFSNTLKALNPDLVIYDYNQPWAVAAASSLNIPAVLFLTFGAVFSSFVIHASDNPGVDYPFQSIYLRDSEKPNFQKLIESTANEVTDKDLFLESIKLQSSNLICIKTCREIEGKYIDYLSVLANKKIKPVGPLVQDPPVNEEIRDVEIMKFLQKKDESSVVFVSFGSEYFLSNEEREEIAHGLELSKVSFIWVVRFPVGEEIRAEEALPEGFIDRVGERGMVVQGWAPQARILGHSSTGGFVSHCGWGSVLESIKSGVPIIAMPMHIDQPLNCRVVEEVGAGLEAKRDQTGRADRKEIARVIRMVMVEEEGREVRRRARELSEKIRMKKEEEIDDVVEELVQLCGKLK